MKAMNPEKAPIQIAFGLYVSISSVTRLIYGK